MVGSKLIETSVIKLVFIVFTMASPGLGQLIFGLPPDTKKLVRHFEKVTLKISKEKCSKHFNDI